MLGYFTPICRWKFQNAPTNGTYSKDVKIRKNCTYGANTCITRRVRAEADITMNNLTIDHVMLSAPANPK